jgi:AcrR family transcriptional regulator
MGRPAKFSRQQLQAAALALVDAHGLGGLTMRALADELGTGPMTLYNHVEGREDLEVLVVEAVMAEARWPRKARADWRDEVRAIARAAWRAVRAHPHAAPLVLTRRGHSPAMLELSEALLAALARSGRSGRQLLIAFRSVTAFVMGFVQVELAGPLSIEPPQAIVARFRALPADRYPHLIEIATAAAQSDAAGEFRWGLDLLIAALKAGGERPQSSRSGAVRS